MEAKSRLEPQEFLNWLSYFEANPPMRDHLNNCQANICYTIAAVNKGKGQKTIPFNKFRLDYKEAAMSDKDKVNRDIRKFFGGLANGKK